MKSAIAIAIMILMLPVAWASAEKSIGYVNMTVINNPPAITGMSIREPYAGSSIECDVNVEDELKERDMINYEWFVNGEKVEGWNKAYLLPEFFKAGDEVRCDAVANDMVQDSNRGSVSVEITNKPLSERVSGLASGITGSASGVTGNAVKAVGSADRTMSILVIIALALVIANVIVYFKK